MHLIVCVDSRGGMSFCGKRQSKDSLLRADILKTVVRLYMNAYSARQFEEQTDKIIARDDFLLSAGEDDYCFCETDDIKDAISRAKTVTLYCWNRAYPYDKAFPVADYKSRWKLLSTEEFCGSSHEKITKEVYKP